MVVLNADQAKIVHLHLFIFSNECNALDLGAALYTMHKETVNSKIYPSLQYIGTTPKWDIQDIEKILINQFMRLTFRPKLSI